MLPTPIFTSNNSEWPLQEYEEKRILNALSLQQQQQAGDKMSLPPLSFNVMHWSIEEEEEEDTENEESESTFSPITTMNASNTYFSDKTASTFINHQDLRRQSLSSSLRCSICQRRFHSQGNLSNHTQLYH